MNEVLCTTQMWLDVELQICLKLQLFILRVVRCLLKLSSVDNLAYVLGIRGAKALSPIMAKVPLFYTCKLGHGWIL